MRDTFTFDLENIMDNLYRGGAFFTVGDKNKANTMTISWGSIGFMWKKPMFMALIRESRYSNEFLGKNKTYTVSIPHKGTMKEALKICGTKSGRNIDKEKEAGIKFIPSKIVETPIVEGCEKYYECRVVFKQEMDLSNIDEQIKISCYPENETKHILYFGEILTQY